MHNHERKNGHGFGFSPEDLETAKKLKKYRMGLIMNEEEDKDGTKTQHRISANEEGELHTLT
jgi:hypothetical protein